MIDDVWKGTQHNLLQVSIISLMVLCIVCITVCAMMITLSSLLVREEEVPGW